MTQKQINDQIEAGKSLRMITQAYTEISSIKLRRIRNQVERARYFFNDISQIYRLVKALAAQQKIDISTLNKNNQLKPSISILITSNYKFYGNINAELIKYFLVNTAKYPTDRVVIGKMGLEYLKTIKYFHPYQPLLLQKDLPNYQELRELVEEVKHYKQILVYYSELKSVLVQIPKVRDINESQAEKFKLKGLEKESQTKHEEKVKGEADVNSYSLIENISNFQFIFEPEVKKMLEFFESQMVQSLLEQCFLEAELSRTASRLTSMDRGQSRANDFLDNEEKLLRASKRQLESARLLESIGSLLRMRREQNV